MTSTNRQINAEQYARKTPKLLVSNCSICFAHLDVTMDDIRLVDDITLVDPDGVQSSGHLQCQTDLLPL